MRSFSPEKEKAERGVRANVLISVEDQVANIKSDIVEIQKMNACCCKAVAWVWWWGSSRDKYETPLEEKSKGELMLASNRIFEDLIDVDENGERSESTSRGRAAHESNNIITALHVAIATLRWKCSPRHHISHHTRSL